MCLKGSNFSEKFIEIVHELKIMKTYNNSELLRYRLLVSRTPKKSFSLTKQNSNNNNNKKMVFANVFDSK